MDTFEKYVESLVDMDYYMDQWDGPPSLHVIWKDEDSFNNTDFGVPDALWDGMPPAFIMYQVTALLAGGMPIPEGVAKALMDSRELAGITFFTEAWGLHVDPNKGSLAENRGGFKNLADHPDAFEFKSAVSVDTEGNIYFYQRNRKQDLPDMPQDAGLGGLGGPVPLSMEALMKMFQFAKDNGEMMPG